jgi:hypothetical protein
MFDHDEILKRIFLNRSLWSRLFAGDSMSITRHSTQKEPRPKGAV